MRAGRAPGKTPPYFVLSDKLLGLLLFFRPTAGAIAVLWLFGAYAIIFGALLLLFAFQLRNVIEVRQEV
ncbi:MAG: hypothetical protein NVS3B14_10790 [Ktedonobacteraceae bacterium]